MRIKRGYADCISKYLEKRRGTTFEIELEKAKKKYDDPRKAIGFALFNVISKDKKSITVFDL